MRKGMEVGLRAIVGGQGGDGPGLRGGALCYSPGWLCVQDGQRWEVILVLLWRTPTLFLKEHCLGLS